MTRFDAIRRQLGDIEKHHERELAKHEMQIRLLSDYRDKLEDQVGIAAEMIAHRDGTSLDAASKHIDEAYEARQATRDAAEAT